MGGTFISPGSTITQDEMISKLFNTADCGTHQIRPQNDEHALSHD